jgi:hypothetical protein
MRSVILLFALLLALPCMAVHNFTINGETSATASIGDTLLVHFEFESVGSAADYSISINMLTISIPLMTSDNAPIVDGGPMDETGVDGSFTINLPLAASFPEDASVVITLTDQGVSATAQLQTIPLDSDFSIAGTVTQESSWINLPVPYGLVWTFYNASPEEVGDLIGDLSLETLIEYLGQDHYFISTSTALLGTYQLMIPDTIPNVHCTVGVYSALDIAGGYVAPDMQLVTVNGNLSNINFLYQQPDGTLSGTVSDEAGNPLDNTFILLSNTADSLNNVFALTDSLGAYSFSLLTGSYYMVSMHTGYTTQTEVINFTGGNIDHDIVMLSNVDTGSVSGLVTDRDGNPLENATVEFFLNGELATSTMTAENGSYSVSLEYGEYTYRVWLSGYMTSEGSLSVNQSDIVIDCTLDPIIATDDQVNALSQIALHVSPNPFNPSTTVSFNLPLASSVTIEVFNARGQRVRTLIQGTLPAGFHEVVWDGTDECANPAASGVYIMRMMSGGKAFVQKSMMLK